MASADDISRSSGLSDIDAQANGDMTRPDDEPGAGDESGRAGRGRTPLGLAVALLAVLAALALRMSLTPVLGISSPFLLFIPAVMVGAWYGGVWPGLFATALSSVLGARYLLSPLTRLPLEEVDRVGLFLVVCLIIVWVQVRVTAATERVELSLAREREARREAQAANRAKDEFLAMVSHELRTPATTVMGWISLINNDKADAALVARGLQVIERNVSLQARLLEDIVDTVRASKGTMRLKREALDLTSLVTAAVDTARPAAVTKGVRLEQKLDAQDVPVFGDAVRLQQVMTNLISNALKFTPEGGSIVVRLERAGDRARISVSDTGVGIEAEFLPFVFERFRRGNHGREGLGLGLAIARHLVQMHGGTIEVASAGAQRGTTFLVTLPIERRNADSTQAGGAPPVTTRA